MFEFERFYACFSIRAYNVRKDCTHAGIDISMTYWTMFYYVYDLPHSICVKPIEYPSILDLKSKHTIFVFSMGFCQQATDLQFVNENPTNDHCGKTKASFYYNVSLSLLLVPFASCKQSVIFTATGTTKNWCNHLYIELLDCFVFLTNELKNNERSLDLFEISRFSSI